MKYGYKIKGRINLIPNFMTLKVPHLLYKFNLLL